MICRAVTWLIDIIGRNFVGLIWPELIERERACRGRGND